MAGGIAATCIPSQFGRSRLLAIPLPPNGHLIQAGVVESRRLVHTLFCPSEKFWSLFEFFAIGHWAVWLKGKSPESMEGSSVRDGKEEMGLRRSYKTHCAEDGSDLNEGGMCHNDPGEGSCRNTLPLKMFFLPPDPEVSKTRR
jgi:hypothetical protein